MSDSTRISSSWRAPHLRGVATEPTRPADDRLSFRDLAAIQIAAAIKGTTRDLSPRETAEVAYDLAAALEEERARRQCG